MTNILVVEPDASAADAVATELRKQGYAARSLTAGRRVLESYGDADLVLLSLDLLDVDGLEVCRSLRAVSDIPLIARTHRDDELERVLALREGADDCVAKTWGMRELKARIEAVLRRSRGTATAPDTISIDPLRIDQRTREVRLNDQLVDLTSKEFELLYILAKNPETVVSRKELMVSVWGANWTTTSRTIDTHVSSLRAKLGCPKWIITVYGVGYRLGHAWSQPRRTAS
jgi:DNA-binding response OmpR family regulator